MTKTNKKKKKKKKIKIEAKTEVEVGAEITEEENIIEGGAKVGVGVEVIVGKIKDMKIKIVFMDNIN